MGSIVLRGIGKAYRQYKSKAGRLLEWIIPGLEPRHTQKWILEDITFEVEPGEAVGIIGINGAGKSTLLKIISGTTHPSKGYVTLEGRVAALLELGMGFHPDFTGRQNVYMAGQLLGLQGSEIDRLMPEIEAFSEIGDYLDQPVRVYSSGMQVRLAFSVATAVRPDILIIDEALSVGDAYFQHKSFDRIRQFNALGTTLLIVSHDKQAIQSICNRAILINAGRLEMQGDPEAVMDYYNALLSGKENQAIKQITKDDGKIQTISGNGKASVIDIALKDSQKNKIETVCVGQNVSLEIIVEARADLPRLVLGYGIKDRLGQVIFGTNTDLTKQELTHVAAGSRFTFTCTFNANLGPGSYSIQTALVSTETHLVDNYEWRDLALIFEVINTDKNHFIGCNWLETSIGITKE